MKRQKPVFGSSTTHSRIVVKTRRASAPITSSTELSRRRWRRMRDGIEAKIRLAASNEGFASGNCTVISRRNGRMRLAPEAIARREK